MWKSVWIIVFITCLVITYWSHVIGKNCYWDCYFDKQQIIEIRLSLSIMVINFSTYIKYGCWRVLQLFEIWTQIWFHNEQRIMNTWMYKNVYLTGTFIIIEVGKIKGVSKGVRYGSLSALQNPHQPSRLIWVL